MWFNFFKRKKKVEEPRVFEGKVITDEEFKEMIRPKSESFVSKEFKEINDLVEEIKQSVY